MSSYKVSEPSALKFLKANGTVVDENGNVVNDATDYWKKVYDQAEPKIAKYLHADGTIEITPTEGKDGMKKVTATVNVVGSGSTLYAWSCHGIDYCFTTTPNPTTSDKALAITQEYYSSLSWFDITDVTEEGIIVFPSSNVRSRDSSADVSLI